MLIFLENNNKIINTEYISSVSEYVQESIINDDLLNLAPGDVIPQRPEVQQSHGIEIILKDRSKVIVENMSVEQFWKLIQSKL